MVPGAGEVSIHKLGYCHIRHTVASTVWLLALHVVDTVDEKAPLGEGAIICFANANDHGQPFIVQVPALLNLGLLSWANPWSL